MNTKGPYKILAYSTPDTERSCDFDTERDTLSEARRHARYCLSAEFCECSEMSGRMARVIVKNSAGEIVEDHTRAADPAVIRAAAKLRDIAQRCGLYSGSRRFDHARAALGYPRDAIELRDAYAAPDEYGDPQWVTLTPGMELRTQAGESIANPVAPVPCANRTPPREKTVSIVARGCVFTVPASQAAEIRRMESGQGAEDWKRNRVD